MLNREQEQALYLIASFRDEYDAAGQEEKMPRAVAAVWAAFELMHTLLGGELVADAFGTAPTESTPRNLQLEGLAHRLNVLSHLESNDFAVSPMSLSKVSEEVRAIANGDAARLLAEFPGTSGRRINAYRLARLQLRALEWHAHLRHVGNAPATAKSAVGSAFGEDWSTISRWRDPITRELGAQALERALKLARQDRWLMAGFWRTPEEAEAILVRNGKAYREELGRSLKAIK